MVSYTTHRELPAALAAIPEHLVREIIDGELVTRRGGVVLVAAARSVILFRLGHRANSSTQGMTVIGRPEVHHEGNVVVPDVAAWPEEAMRPHLDSDWRDVPTPCWVCDVVTPGVDKRHWKARLRIYAEAGIRHMWIVDPRQQILEAFELRDHLWTKLGAWNSDDSVRAPPFDAISFPLADLWPLDPPLGMNEDPTPYYAGDR